MKSSVEQIRERFDKDVERFSNLDTGQTATMDGGLCMDLVTTAAALTTPHAKDLLDIGCGAGNYSLLMLQHIPSLRCTLNDLSQPMLERAAMRIKAQSGRDPATLQGDMREMPLAKDSFDIVLVAAALHHLRSDDEWRDMFRKIHDALRPGGSFWVFDYIEQSTRAIQQMMKGRYGEYLVGVKGGGPAGEAYRDAVFAYVEEEDTPRPLTFQLDMLREAGFVDLEVLHKNGLFAAFGGRESGNC